MTNEDKKIVADYMWWAQYKYPSYYLNTKGDIESHHFDLNDAALVVAEMQKRGEWNKFLYWTDNNSKPYREWEDFVAHLYNADNFFSAFCEWRKGK